MALDDNGLPRTLGSCRVLCLKYVLFDDSASSQIQVTISTSISI